MEVNIANIVVISSLVASQLGIAKYLDTKIVRLREYMMKVHEDTDKEMNEVKGNYINRFEIVQGIINQNKLEIIREISALKTEIVKSLGEIKTEFAVKNK